MHTAAAAVASTLHVGELEPQLPGLLSDITAAAQNDAKVGGGGDKGNPEYLARAHLLEHTALHCHRATNTCAHYHHHPLCQRLAPKQACKDVSMHIPAPWVPVLTL
jgi:hypothetical protein